MTIWELEFLYVLHTHWTLNQLWNLPQCSWVVHETFQSSRMSWYTYWSDFHYALSLYLCATLKMKWNSQTGFPSNSFIAVQFLVETHPFWWNSIPWKVCIGFHSLPLQLLCVWFWDRSGKHPFSCVPLWYTEFHFNKILSRKYSKFEIFVKIKI